MVNSLIDFYFNYCPVFTERFEKNNIKFLFSKFVNDEYSNIAILNKSSNKDYAKTEFEKRRLSPVFYSFEKPDFNSSILYTDNFLYYQNVSALYNKFKKFKSKDISLIKVDNEKLRNEYMIINDKCYSEKSYDNPYSNLDNFAYSKSVFEFQKNETNSKTIIYLIRYKNANVGCIILSIKDKLCYVSGLAILKEFRKTKVFTVMIDILEILISNNVENIFCITEVGEYPEKLYKKIGFKSAGIAYGFKFK